MTAKKSTQTQTHTNDVSAIDPEFFDGLPRSTDPDTSVQASAATHARMAQVGSSHRAQLMRQERASRKRGARRRNAEAGLSKLRRGLPLLAACAVGGLALVTTIPAMGMSGTKATDSSAIIGSFSERGEEYAPAGQSLQAKGAAVTTSRDSLSTTSVRGTKIGPSYIMNPNGVIRWPYPAFFGFGDLYGPRDLSDCSYCSPFEEGIDIMAPMGTPIMNTADGVVTKVHNVAAGSGYGTYVQITHNVNGLQFVTQHSHMMEGSIPLVEGQAVKMGDIVGLTGMTGSTSAPHDCFLIFQGGGTTDPLAFMNQYAA